MHAKTALAFCGAALLTVGAVAQTPTPVVVQAMPAASAGPVAAQPWGAGNSAGVAAALKALQELKAANDELLRKQAATLLQLDEMEKAADQIKIFTKRG